MKISKSQNLTNAKISRPKVCGVRVLKGAANVALCGCKVIDFTRYCIKILDVHFSCSTILAEDRNYLYTASNTEGLICQSSERNLTLTGKIRIFETFSLPKILYLAGTNLVPI